MQIGELAKRSGLPIDTLRYYEKQGVIPEPPRKASGYRDYPVITLQYLHLIHSAKSVGFSLKECQNLLAIFISRDKYTCAEVKTLADQKLQDLETQMQKITLMHNTLKSISDACCGGAEVATYCSILNKLEEGVS
jgi:MerR family Zn(II)-responsive transcriptional regulator of zntA